MHHVTVENAALPISIKNGSLQIFDSQFTGNTDAVIVAASGTSTLVARSVFKSNPGAAPIKAAGSINITDSQFIDNGASYFDDYYDGQNCNLTVDRGTFESNTVDGALNLRCGATISHSIFSANASNASGGALALSGVAATLALRANKFLNNHSALDGGAIYWQPQSSGNRAITISYSSFIANSARSGGAIKVTKSTASSGSSTINVSVSAFSRNTANASGGAICATDAQLFVARATFADNSGGIRGGAVSLENATHTRSVLGNALLVRNSAEDGSAFFGSNASFINSTIDSNINTLSVLSASIVNSGSTAHIKLANSIVSNNAAGGCKPVGMFDDGGQNLQFPKNDCGKSILIADPHLDSMYIPLPKTPAMGNGNLKICTSNPINGRDVYGVSRPSGGVCTIGAAEGDINVLTHNRLQSRQITGQQGNATGCACDDGLVQKLMRMLPYSP